MKPIVVLGMHRSGTSAATRALALLGAALGPPEHAGEYWENREMRRVNVDLLATFGGAWDCPPALEEGWVRAPAARALLARGRDVLAQEYRGARVMVWKDPRTCLTLPFWQEVFDEEPVVVLMHRHPVEVARSLLERDAIGGGHAFAMWERYNTAALVSSIGRQTVVVAYEMLTEDPTGVMTALARALAGWGVHLPNAVATTELELDPERRHHRVAAPDTLADALATEQQRSLFALLREAGGTHDRFSSPRRIPSPHPLSVELMDFAARLKESSDLLRSFESRRRLLRHLVDRTLEQAAEHRGRRRDH